MNLRISEHRPSLDLSPYVHSYWFGQFNVNGEKTDYFTVVPNGCIELIVHLTDTHCALTYDHETWSASPDFTLMGLYTETYEVQFPDTVDVFGIRLFPDGIRHIFGVMPVEFLSSYADGITVLGQNLMDFCNRIRDLDQQPHQLSITEKYLRRQLELHHQSYDYTHQAMHEIRKVAGMSTFREVSATIPISDRQLQRSFKHQYGITVSDYMRLSRMNAVQNYLQVGNQNLTEMAYDLEFTDQSHFIREFKHYVGTTPGKFRRQREQYIVNPALSN